MDTHILIVISCVFLASLCSLLFINKFFRRKTFEEIIAEKKALNEKIYGQTKATIKKPKKIQLKKEMKREKKQRQKEQQKDANEQDDSDALSEQQSVEDELVGLSKAHVEFEPDPEVITPATTIEHIRRVSNAEKESIGNASGSHKQKMKKDKKGGKSAGILINKNEPIAVKENLIVEETLNNFEVKPPKDIVELKKHQQQPLNQSNKKEKHTKKEKNVPEKAVVASEQSIEAVPAAKEQNLPLDKTRIGSPKNQQNNNNNNSNHNKNKQNKKQMKETAAAKELVLALDKLSDNDTIGVSLLMNMFRRAELNRSEIQLLIDYLLNKQQDMPSSHSEWSDDICQKLKRQLEEKERALAEQQEASIGIQAKLRELRTEVNTERAQMNAATKSYIDKINSKDQEIANIQQELQSLNDKFAVERQQFQAKMLREKQTGSQELLAQLQIMQNELALKDKCIADLTCIVNASRQAVEESQAKNEILQSQAQQIHALEQQREELEQASNNRIFDFEKLSVLETENSEYKLELCNLQNALESAKADLSKSIQDLVAMKSELTITRNGNHGEKETNIQLQSKNDDLEKQLAGLNARTEQQYKEQSSVQATLDALRSQLSEKDSQLAELNAKHSALLQQLNGMELNSHQDSQQHKEMQALVEALKADLASKHKQLIEIEQKGESFAIREKELLQQLQEQREKNDDLRMKNMKMIEALQNAEAKQQQQLLTASKNAKSSSVTKATDDVNASQIREIFQRLYPDAVKACANTALTVPFEQWAKEVVATQVRLATIVSSSNKSTQLNNTSNSNHTSSHNSHNENSLNSESTNNSNSRINNSKSSNVDNSEIVDMQQLQTQNCQLRARIDELTKLAKKTDNTLSELEGRAREQDENWRSIVRSKDEQIYKLQHSNGEQDI